MLFYCKGGKTHKLRTRQSPSEAQTSIRCLNKQHLRHLRQHSLPSQISEGFFGNSQYLHSAREPRELRRLQQPQLLLYSAPAPAAKKLGFKETTGRSTLCPALFETKMNLKAAPTLWHWQSVGGTWEAEGSRSPPGSSCFIPPPIRSKSEHFPWKSIATEVSSWTLKHRG